MKWIFPDKEKVEIKDMTTEQLKDTLKLLNEYYSSLVSKEEKPHDFSALKGMMSKLCTAEGFECLEEMNRELMGRKDK